MEGRVIRGRGSSTHSTSGSRLAAPKLRAKAGWLAPPEAQSLREAIWFPGPLARRLHRHLYRVAPWRCSRFRRGVDKGRDQVRDAVSDGGADGFWKIAGPQEPSASIVAKRPGVEQESARCILEGRVTRGRRSRTHSTSGSRNSPLQKRPIGARGPMVPWSCGPVVIDSSHPHLPDHHSTQPRWPGTLP